MYPHVRITRHRQVTPTSIPWNSSTHAAHTRLFHSLEESRLLTIAEYRPQQTAEHRPHDPAEMLPLNTNKAKAYFACGASALHNRGASITGTCFGAFVMLAEPWIYSPTEYHNILYRRIVSYIARGATTYFVLGALAPHTSGTLSPVTPEPTRELAEPRDTLIEDTEFRLQNAEERHRPHVTA